MYMGSEGRTAANRPATRLQAGSSTAPALPQGVEVRCPDGRVVVPTGSRDQTPCLRPGTTRIRSQVTSSTSRSQPPLVRSGTSRYSVGGPNRDWVQVHTVAGPIRSREL